MRLPSFLRGLTFGSALKPPPDELAEMIRPGRWPAIEEGMTETKVHWGPPSTASRAAVLLSAAAATLKERDATYQASDKLYSDVMELLFPDGVQLEDSRDHHRFHIFMLMMVKVTRYARNWEDGHDDSLVDLINYVAMLQAVDRDKSSLPWKPPAGED